MPTYVMLVKATRWLIVEGKRGSRRSNSKEVESEARWSRLDYCVSWLHRLEIACPFLPTFQKEFGVGQG